MSGISAMFFGGTAYVFAGAWDVSGSQSYGAGLALGYDGTNPYVVLAGYTDPTTELSAERVLRIGAARTTSWTRSAYPTLGGARASAIAVDTSYNSFFAGNIADSAGNNIGSTLVKTDTSGVPLWQRKFTAGTNYKLPANAVTTDSSGNVYMAGTVGIDDAGFLVKYNSSGVIQWQRTLTTAYDCTIQSVAVDGSGNVIVAGYYKSSAGGNSYAYVAKYNSSGTLQWQKYINQTATGYATYIPALVCDSSDNIYFYMSTSDISNSYGYFIKLNSSGTMQWTRRVTNNNDYSTGGAYIDADGYIYFVAYNGTTGGTYIAKYNSSGTRQFDRKMTNVTSPCGIVVDTAGYMWVSGSTSNSTNDYVFLSRLPSDGPGSLTFNLAAPSGTISVVVSAPNLTENTTALTIATSSLTDAAGTFTDSAGSLNTGTFSTTAYTAP